MAGQLYFTPFLPALSSVGTPVPGAKLFLFYTGTNNLAPVYGDSALTVPLPNPVVSDLAARFPAIYLDTSITYRVRITDSNGVSLGDDTDPYLPGTFVGPTGPKGDKGNPGGNVSSTGVFSDLPTQTVPAGTDLVQTSGTTRGVSVADTSLSDSDVSAQPRFIKKTANGRYFRRDEAFIDLRQVGLNDDAANNTGAFNEALDYLKRFGNNNSTLYRGTPRLKLPSGDIPINRINVKQTVIIEGDGVGLEGANATILRASPTGGITIERADTLNGALVAPAATGGDGSILRNFALIGGTVGQSRNANSGVSLKARATLEQLYIEGFAGSGVRINANAGGSGEARGNANVWKAKDLTINGCFDGMYINGADANAGYGQGLNVNNNVSCGVLDMSFLGNTHIGYHSSGNGNNADGKFVMVSFGGIRYVPAWGADGLWSTTQPGTNANVWKAFESGGPIGLGLPTWYNGIPVKFGAAYSSTDRNQRSLWLGCYTEGTQAPPQIQWPSLAIGGFLGQVGDGMWVNGEQRAVNAALFRAGGAFLDGNRGAVGLSVNSGLDLLLQSFAGENARFSFGGSDNLVPLVFHGPGTSDPRGSNTIELKRLGLPGGGALGAFVTSAPTDNLPFFLIAWNKARTNSTQPIGWSNIPNTTNWVPFGAQSA